jgi:NNP family nitrate/nitrite transporter-like MFS transporter
MALFRFPLFSLAFLTAIFYLNFVSRVMLGPFLPLIEQDLGLGHSEAGSLFLFIQIGYATGLLGSGLVSWRFSHRRNITVSSIAVGISMLGLSWAASLGGTRLWLVLLGAAAGLYLPSGIATITHLVHEAHWGKALAFHELAPNIAFVTAPLLAEALLAAISWRGVLAVVGGVGILLGGCFAHWGHGGDLRGEPPRLQSVARVMRNPSMWIMMYFFTMGIGSGLGLYGMLPLYLVSGVGMSLRAANSITGLSRLSCLAVIFVSGWLTDRIGHRRALALALTTMGALTLGMGLFSGPRVTPVFIFFQAAAAVLFFPPAFSAVSRLVPPASRNLALSLTIAVGVILGGGGVPSLIGYLAEVASFSLAFAIVGILALCSPLLLPIGEWVDVRSQDGDDSSAAPRLAS